MRARRPARAAGAGRSLVSADHRVRARRHADRRQRRRDPHRQPARPRAVRVSAGPVGRPQRRRSGPRGHPPAPRADARPLHDGRQRQPAGRGDERRLPRCGPRRPRVPDRAWPDPSAAAGRPQTVRLRHPARHQPAQAVRARHRRTAGIPARAAGYPAVPGVLQGCRGVLPGLQSGVPRRLPGQPRGAGRKERAGFCLSAAGGSR